MFYNTYLFTAAIHSRCNNIYMSATKHDDHVYRVHNIILWLLLYFTSTMYTITRTVDTEWPVVNWFFRLSKRETGRMISHIIYYMANWWLSVVNAVLISNRIHTYRIGIPTFNDKLVRIFLSFWKTIYSFIVYSNKSGHKIHCIIWRISRYLII